MKLDVIETPNGVYIRDPDDKSYGSTYLTKRVFDGENPEPTFHHSWVKVPCVPRKIERWQSVPDTNVRYELRDMSIANDNIPAILPYDSVNTDEDGNWEKPYSHLQSLYERKSDKQPPILVDVQFEIASSIKLDAVTHVNGFSYPVQRTQWEHEGTTLLTGKDVQNQLLDKILFPDIVLPSRPCKLTSEQSYKIVREHIKRNINPKAAIITSDYNFCFSVEKVIPICDAYDYVAELAYFGSNKRKKPRYETRHVTTRKSKCFEMTFSPENYKGYTPIVGFYGDSVDNLKQKIDSYLSELMSNINEPLTECPECKGLGAISRRQEQPE